MSFIATIDRKPATGFRLYFRIKSFRAPLTYLTVLIAHLIRRNHRRSTTRRRRVLNETVFSSLDQASAKNDVADENAADGDIHKVEIVGREYNGTEIVLST